MPDERRLFLYELRDPMVGEVEQRQQRVSTERDGLRRALNLDEAAIAGLDDVHVDVRPAVVLVRQIEQRLAGGGAADPQGLLARLAVVGGAMGGTAAPTLESLGWRNGSLQLQMVAADTDALARFAQALTARGLNADVESTTSSEKGVSAQINVTARPSS